MIGNKTILAITLARGGSKRIPRKNPVWNSKKPEPSSSKYPFTIYNIVFKPST